MASNQLELDDGGMATYVWKAGFPNITEPFTRAFNITYMIGDREYQWKKGNGLEAIVLGSLPTTNNFVTRGPEMVTIILRDPPGTNSFAEWTSGSVVSNSRTDAKAWTSDISATTVTKLGVDQTIGTGIGVIVLTDVESTNDLTVGLHTTVEGQSGNSWTTTTTKTNTVATSSAPEYVGANGDVFIGKSTNLVYGKAREVGFHRNSEGSVDLNLKPIVTTKLKFGTSFNYSANYIENVLIPNLEDLRANLLQTVPDMNAVTNNTDKPIYVTQLSPDDENYGQNGTYKFLVPTNTKENYNDEVNSYTNDIDNWKKQLLTNEEEKVTAYNKKAEDKEYVNISFDSGTSVTRSVQVDSVTTSTYENKVMGIAVLGDEFGVGVNGVGVVANVYTETGGGTNKSHSEEQTQTTTFTYILAEEGDDDALTVDVYSSKQFGPIFRTLGGQTSNPYEGEVKTKYYSPGTTIMEATMQIEVPKIRVNNNRTASLSNVPTGTPANFTLQLTNESQIDEDVYYKLLLIDESNNKGAKVSIDGMPLTDGRLIKIPAGTEVTKALQISQTDQGVLDYEDIGIVLASQTQFDPTSTWDVIADTVFVSVHYVPSSTDVKMNLGQAVMNTTNLPNVKKELNLTFNNFDRNYKNLKAFRVQYKALGATDWTTYREYVLADDGHLSSYQEVLPDDANVTCPINVASLPDGDYVFRVLSVCSYGNDEVYKSSNEIAITKDMEKPRPLGQPTPTNGILTAADDISITFNEDIVKGELTETANFRVTGVLNEQEVEHETALNMTDAEVTASTETDINLSGKSFSMDMWMNAKGKGTILSHGNASSKFSLGVTEDSKLAVTVANETYTSVNAIPQNKWVFLTLNYQAQNNGGLLSANVAEDANEIELFKNLDVVKYAGNGMLAVGKNMMGAIHELTLWDEAHDMTSALLNRSKT